MDLLEVILSRNQIQKFLEGEMLFWHMIENRTQLKNKNIGKIVDYA